MEGGEERAHLDLGRAWIEGEGERTGIFIPPGSPLLALSVHTHQLCCSTPCLNHSIPINIYKNPSRNLQTHTHTLQS